MNRCHSLAPSLAIAFILCTASASSAGRDVRTIVPLNGLGYFVRDEGPIDGKAVLLLHGMPDDGEVWRSQIDALLAHGYRVLTPDLVGYGRTVAAGDLARYKTDNIALDMVTLLDQLHIPKVHLVGHDWGGGVAWSLMLAAPGRLTSAAVISIGHPAAFAVVDFTKMRWNWYMFLQANPGTPDVYRAGNGRWLRELLRSHPHRDDVVAQYLQPGRLEAMLRWDEANPVADLLIAQANGAFAHLPNVSVPTMGIWPDGDEFLWEEQVRESGKYVSAEWRYEKIAGASHWPMLDRPQELSALLIDWIGKH